MMHVLGLESAWDPPTHPPTPAVSPLLPALLAACELGESKVSGSDLLRAFAASVEFQGRLPSLEPDKAEFVSLLLQQINGGGRSYARERRQAARKLATEI